MKYWSSVLKTFIIYFALQIVGMLIFDELRTATPKRWIVTIIEAFIFSLIMSAIFTSSTFQALKEKKKSN